jgi:hypothetical protein
MTRSPGVELTMRFEGIRMDDARYRALWISDVHLGTRECEAEALQVVSPAAAFQHGGRVGTMVA